jgi:hypothetical protein
MSRHPSLVPRQPGSVPSELSRFLGALFGPTPGALLDIRIRRDEGAMDEYFSPVRGRRHRRRMRMGWS